MSSELYSNDWQRLPFWEIYVFFGWILLVSYNFKMFQNFNEKVWTLLKFKISFFGFGLMEGLSQMVKNQNRLFKIAAIDFLIEQLPWVFDFFGCCLVEVRYMFYFFLVVDFNKCLNSSFKKLTLKKKKKFTFYCQKNARRHILSSCTNLPMCISTSYN